VVETRSVVRGGYAVVGCVRRHAHGVTVVGSSVWLWGVT
jgi:hypothetical protein